MMLFIHVNINPEQQMKHCLVMRGEINQQQLLETIRLMNHYHFASAMNKQLEYCVLGPL